MNFHENIVFGQFMFEATFTVWEVQTGCPDLSRELGVERYEDVCVGCFETESVWEKYGNVLNFETSSHGKNHNFAYVVRNFRSS